MRVRAPLPLPLRPHPNSPKKTERPGKGGVPRPLDGAVVDRRVGVRDRGPVRRHPGGDGVQQERAQGRDHRQHVDLPVRGLALRARAERAVADPGAVHDRVRLRVRSVCGVRSVACVARAYRWFVYEPRLRLSVAVAATAVVVVVVVFCCWCGGVVFGRCCVGI